MPFLLEEETNWPIEFNELDRDTELQSWRASLRESNLVGFFNTHPDSLNISPALSRWIQNRGKGKQEANYSDSILNGIDGFFFPNYEQPTNRVEDNISLLLDYKSRLTDFFGRNKIRKEIDNWLYQDNHRLSCGSDGSWWCWKEPFNGRDM
ncbi:MAG: hypothetical protein IPK76_21970 [Lewinellaceae bacterium]|nr:hypothetical protein [Lewinellaceae bacterium]